MAQATLQSSLVGELEADIEIKSDAKKFYKVLTGRPQDVPKTTPDSIQGCELEKGELGKVGRVLFWNYEIDGQPQVAKERIETVDPKKNLMAFSIIEGAPMKEFKSFLTTIKATPKQRGPGSVVKCNIKYERINEKMAHPENLLAMFVKVLKGMDGMILSEE